MSGEIQSVPAQVPIKGGRDVTISPGKPWPSAYRGSKYSLVESRNRGREFVVRWQHRELPAVCAPPTGLVDAMEAVGKSESDGRGSFRITADGEVLTKVASDSYIHSDEAPHSDGWIPVYLGRLDGKVGFDDINTNPSIPAGEFDIWDGFPFNHGERWAVSINDELIWKRQDYRFTSAFDHQELVERYNDLRTNTGRLYINEHGQIWINVPRSEIPADQTEAIESTVAQWRTQSDETGQRLVTRRLKATSPDDDPENGYLPIHIGHLTHFDGGVIPRPVVTDDAYFVDASHDPANSFD